MLEDAARATLPPVYDAGRVAADRFVSARWVAFAQFVILTPHPRTVDLAAWEKRLGGNADRVAGIPITPHWPIPQAQRPKVYMPHQVMSPDEIRACTQAVWDHFYGLQHAESLRRGR